MITGVQERSQPQGWLFEYTRGDRAAGDRLAEYARQTVRRRLHTLGLAPQDAEDIVQDCVATVFASLADYDESKGTVDAWLSGFARNAARTWWRGAYARRRSESPLESVAEPIDEREIDLGGSGAVEEAVGLLNPVDQELIQMRFGFGYSFDEIAEMAGMTSVNARKRVSRAVESLRRHPGLRRELGFAS